MEGTDGALYGAGRPYHRQKGQAMPATGTKIEVVFDFDKETPGTLRFAESGLAEDERGQMGTIWIRKDIAETLGNPQRVVVTVEAA